MSGALQFDYVVVGHVTRDVLEDGSSRPGGTALYAGLQAARLGARTLIVTRGVPQEIESMLEPYASELELRVQPARTTTTLATAGAGVERRQRVLAWAGAIDRLRLPACGILHLAPVAAELASMPEGEWGFLGLTPQGLTRRWRGPGGEMVPGAPGGEAAAIAARCRALVLGEPERPLCAELIAAALAGGATVAVTAGPGPNEILLPEGPPLRLDVTPLARPVEDLGAGDVYAAAFFTALAGGAAPREAAELGNAAAAARMRGAGPGAIARAEDLAAPGPPRPGSVRPAGSGSR